jgi:hypothetical protein
MYLADIDTTFAVYRKSNYQGHLRSPAIRVAGDYTAIHLPWFLNLDIITELEKQQYLQKNKSTHWIKNS